jgi:hypothetical protein
VRRGLDDYRYMDLLWRMITAAKKSGDAKAIEAAKSAEAIAREILGSPDFTYQGLENGTPPPSAATLEKWHWRTAAACVELLKVVSLEKALATTAERPGPFDLPAVREEAMKFGPELIPDGGFENGIGPWKAAGKGAGSVDASEHHSGKSSFKLENVKDANGMDVEVCVWGWGGEGPTMNLGRGKTYEFSCWVKCVSGKPSLRFSFPKPEMTRNAAASEGTPDANGWRRLSQRVTMAQDAKPGYLAVWLQGPGSIWCDDFSLREVEVPPFFVESDRTVLDSSDRLVPVALKQAGGNAELAIRVHVPGETAERVVKVPAGGSTEVEFSADALSVGKHELTAKLDGDSFSRSVTFERVKGPFEK